MKLLRLLKITKYLKNLQEEVQINPAIIELCTLGVQTVFLVHLAGCLWHWTAILSLPDDEPERSQAALSTWLVVYSDRLQAGGHTTVTRL